MGFCPRGVLSHGGFCSVRICPGGFGPRGVLSSRGTVLHPSSHTTPVYSAPHLLQPKPTRDYFLDFDFPDFGFEALPRDPLLSLEGLSFPSPATFPVTSAIFFPAESGVFVDACFGICCACWEV